MAIKPHLKQTELEHGTIVLIVRQPLKRATKWLVFPPSGQEAPQTARKSTKLRMLCTIVIPPESQIIVSFTTGQQGLRIVQPLRAVYEKYQLPIANRVCMVTLGCPFQVLVFKWVKQLSRLVENQFIGFVIPKPLEMLYKQVTAFEFLGPSTQRVGKSTDYVHADGLLAPNRQPEVTTVTPAENNEQFEMISSMQGPL